MTLGRPRGTSENGILKARDCPSCGGTGMVRLGVCDRCSGTGEIVTGSEIPEVE